MAPEHHPAPQLTSEGGARAGAGVASGAAVAGVLSRNELITNNLNTLFVPSEVLLGSGVPESGVPGSEGTCSCSPCTAQYGMMQR